MAPFLTPPPYDPPSTILPPPSPPPTFPHLLQDIVKKYFDDLEAEVIIEPLILCHFACGIGDPKYALVESWAELYKLLQEVGIEILGADGRKRTERMNGQLHLFFYKKTVYKNIQAEIPEKIRTSVRTSQPQIMARK